MWPCGAAELHADREAVCDADMLSKNSYLCRYGNVSFHGHGSCHPWRTQDALDPPCVPAVYVKSCFEDQGQHSLIQDVFQGSLRTKLPDTVTVQTYVCACMSMVYVVLVMDSHACR